MSVLRRIGITTLQLAVAALVMGFASRAHAGICYSAYVQNVGWQSQVCDGSVAGTTYQSLRMEAIKIQPPSTGGSVCYQAYIQNTGWQAPVCNGQVAGTMGQSLRIEALKVWLVGAPAGYSVCYKAQEQALDWGPTACDGYQVGTVGHSLRMEAVTMDLVSPGRNAGGQCYVAFVHGSGEDHTADTDAFFSSTNWVNGGREAFWNKPSHRAYPTETAFSLTKHAARLEYPSETRCIGYRVGYNGNVEWWNGSPSNPGAAWKVAADLNTFINTYNIPDGKLIVVTHSMGGNIMRWIANQGVANAPYFNYNGAQYDSIVRKTKYVVTIQAPHAGSQAVDTLYGEADQPISDAEGYAAQVFDIRNPDARTNTLRRAYMESAAIDSGWLADYGRITNLYTIASFQKWGTGDSDDGNCDTASDALCYTSGIVNGYCGLCIWGCSGVSSDGAVEFTSADGWFSRRGQYMAGARTPWLQIGHNHNHGRFDRLSTNIYDRLWNYNMMNAPVG